MIPQKMIKLKAGTRLANTTKGAAIKQKELNSTCWGKKITSYITWYIKIKFDL